MVKLEVNDKINYEVLYFHNMKECNEYLYVFNDHWCNVPWKSPVEIPDDADIPYQDRACMDMPPKKRAEADLSWGFSLVKSLEIELNYEQNKVLTALVNKL